MTEGSGGRAAGKPEAHRSTWLRSGRLWISAVAALLALGSVLSATGIWVEQRAQAPAQTALRSQLRPAQIQVEELIKAYDDQETGLRGFLLTGLRESLQPYADGGRDIDRLTASLRELLGEHAAAAALLEDVQALGARWQRTIAEPQIAARRDGPLPQSALVDFTRRGKVVFDDLRAEVGALSTEVGRLIEVQLRHFDAAQGTARALQRISLALAVIGMLLLAVVIWQMSSKPLRRLVAGVEAVAAGDYDRPVPQRGAQEFAQLGRAVDVMRTRLLERSAALSAAQEEILVLEERDRVATRLQDMTLKRLFALGLTLSSLASSDRQPTPAELHRLVAETDAIITELREVIFALEQIDSIGEKDPPDPGTRTAGDRAVPRSGADAGS